MMYALGYILANLLLVAFVLPLLLGSRVRVSIGYGLAAAFAGGLLVLYIVARDALDAWRIAQLRRRNSR